MADSIREALTAAYEKAEPADDKISDDVVDTGPVDDAGPVTSSDTTEVSSEGATGGESIPVKDGDEPAGGTPPPAAPAPAPASWSEDERADWAKVPESARKAIERREGEMNRALQHSAEARRRVSELDRVAAPFQPLMASYGVRVEEVVGPLLATRAALEVGTPQQKAELIANVCADFGLDIAMLDEALSARYANGAPTPRYEPQMPADILSHPSLAPVKALLDQVRGAQRAQAEQVLAEFKAKPHYEDVRHTMADLIDQASAKGKSLALGDAYDVALRLHGLSVAPATGSPGNPSVSEAAAILARSRKAASSVSGNPIPTAPRKPGEGSLRDELEAQFRARR